MAADEQPDEQHDDEPRERSGTFSFMVRHRIRGAFEETHRLAMLRIREARRQGGAATPAGFVAEVRALHRAQQLTNGRHGPALHAALVEMRRCYIALACSAILLAERCDRPEELPKGEKSNVPSPRRKGERATSERGSYTEPDFTVE